MKTVKHILAVLFFLSISTSSWSEETIRLASGEWAPYQSQKLKYYGLASRIVTEAFALEGVNVEYEFLPWKRSYEMARTGKCDGTLIWNRKKERSQYFYYSDTIVSSDKVFFHLKSYTFDWNSIDDLKGIPIGGTGGYNYGEAFHNADDAKKITVYWVTKDQQNFHKLLKGRIEIFPNTINVGYFQLQQMFKQREFQLFTHHPHPLMSDTYHLLLSKNIERNERMLALFNTGLQRLRKSGKLDQYIAESQRGEYLMK